MSAYPELKPDAGSPARRETTPFLALSVLGGAALVLALCALIYIWGLWKVPFYEKGEPREGLVVWEIWHNGDWILPLRGGVDIPSKPPLFHWIAAVVSVASGTFNEFTVRFPSALLASLGVLLVYFAGARLWGVGAGLVAAAVLATSPEWWRAAVSARVDMTLTFFMLCTFLYFYFLYKSGGGVAPSLLLAFFAGLATLAKGPVGAALPGIAALLFLGFRRDFGFIKRLYLPISIPFGIAVAGSWYALAWLRGGEKFFLRQIAHEIIGTPLGGAGHNHNIFYYVPALIAGMAPWSLFFPALAIFLFRQRRRLAEKELLYPLAWFGAVFVVLSFALGKRSVYVLPLYPAVALLFAAWWSELSAGRAAEIGWAKAAAFAIAAVFAVWGVTLLAQAFGLDVVAAARSFMRPKSRENLALVGGMLNHYRLILSLCALASLAGAVFLFGEARRHAWSGVMLSLAIVLMISLSAIQNTFHPAFAANYSFRSFMARVREKTPADTPIVFYKSGGKAASFYARAYLPSFQPLQRPSRPPYYLLLSEGEWDPLRGRRGLTEIDASATSAWDGGQRLVLVSVDAQADLRLPDIIEPTEEGAEP
ncbi:MAG TPA: glycosyltransferase family 39 protein [Verrucomicrobiae bacterium]|jgi:4-amino-4-deoxy-L-arabinose transferase-like glycosyltransferase|nr:glycosyltransferase family 39 protein [Verrucomicrobiae bacterium]